MLKLRRYWFEFDSNTPLKIKVGVTAYYLNDALAVIKEKIFKAEELPPYTKCIEDIDIGKLDQNLVINNMHTPNLWGIWFPMGYRESR
jgi:hypothetical protein